MLSSWPPKRVPPRDDIPPVRSRHVLFVPGYDPDADKRTRMLFVREFGRYARRFGLERHRVSAVTRTADERRLTWTVEAAAGGWSTGTTFEVLRWDDIVKADFRRPVPLRVGLLLVGMADSLLSGVLAKFFRFNWKFGGVILYPFVMICLLGLCAAGAGSAAAALAGLLPVAPHGLQPGLKIVAGLVAAAALVVAAIPLFERWFVWHLLHDWVFNWQHGNGRRPDYESRVDHFAERFLEVARTSHCDEILVVGHSSGSIMAVEIVARALERDAALGRRGAALALLTVGSCLPLVALNPRAKRAHAGVRRIALGERVLWVEYQAPQDWMNFPGFNAARDLGQSHADCVNPVIRSARFAETMAPAAYAAILWRPFRMHFQFLMANDRPGEYDFFAMTCGHVPLASRCLAPDGALPPLSGLSETGSPNDRLDPTMQRRIETVPD